MIWDRPVAAVGPERAVRREMVLQRKAWGGTGVGRNRQVPAILFGGRRLTFRITPSRLYWPVVTSAIG